MGGRREWERDGAGRPDNDPSVPRSGVGDATRRSTCQGEGAGGGIRTHTGWLPEDFKSRRGGPTTWYRGAPTRMVEPCSGVFRTPPIDTRTAQSRGLRYGYGTVAAQPGTPAYRSPRYESVVGGKGVPATSDNDPANSSNSLPLPGTILQVLGLGRVAWGLQKPRRLVQDCKTPSRRPLYFFNGLLEAAVAGGCIFIVSYNKRDFEGAARFGIEVVTARELLQRMGELRWAR